MPTESQIDKLTLGDLKIHQGRNPLFKNLYQQLLIDSYESFADYAEASLDDCILLLERNPEQHFKKAEDEISISIRDMLITKGIDAEHDVQHGGHVDIYIKSNDWIYLVEAKIFKGEAYSKEGWLQLTTRYASGHPCNRGGILLYLQKHEMTKQVMDQWSICMKDLDEEDMGVKVCERNVLALNSSHILQRTGLPFYVRHMPVSLYFKPRDESGRKSKKYK